jgi:hypothetical protein
MREGREAESGAMPKAYLYAREERDSNERRLIEDFAQLAPGVDADG